MLRVSNKDARCVWLWSNGLGATPTGSLDVMEIIRRLGFVQIDTVRNVTRAHHHILWSRNQNYRENMLWPLLGEKRQLFEHYSHDACLLPMEFYPMWRRQFERMGERASRTDWYGSGMKPSSLAAVKNRIDQDGPLSTHAFSTKIAGKKKMWAKPPHKKALELMWYRGELATSRRVNFVKYYDLAERVFAKELRAIEHADEAQIDWLCSEAMARLSFGTPAEIRYFWDACGLDEVKKWVTKKEELVPLEIEGADGSITLGYGRANIEAILSEVPKPTSRLRILNPFDPAIRDRKRLLRLFGFEYVNEMFVPLSKRKWGYYVYPLLEGARFVGRVELKAKRDKGQLFVIGFWPEPGVKWSEKRHNSLSKELTRFARLVGIESVDWQCQHPA